MNIIPSAQNYIGKKNTTAEEISKKKLASTQQSLANQIVSSSLATNPNAGQIQQMPAKQ